MDFVRTGVRRHIITVLLPLQLRSFTVKKALLWIAVAVFALSASVSPVLANNPVCPPTIPTCNAQ
jgi:hypothetical protein